MSDTNCPYCNAEIEINHDDGYGFNEDRLHQQECPNCEKVFGYTTSIMYSYNTKKVDCLNDSPHKWKFVNRSYKEWCIMRCTECEKERRPRKEEFAEANYQEFKL